MYLDYAGDPNTVSDELANGTFQYAGLHISHHGEAKAFTLNQGVTEDYATALGIAKVLAPLLKRPLGTTPQHDTFTANFLSLSSTPARDLTEIEAEFFVALYKICVLRSGEEYVFDGGTVKRRFPLDVDVNDRPEYSVETTYSSGGSYTAQGALYSVRITPPLYVGAGVTINHFSDRHPATVIKSSPSGKTVTVRKDKSTIINGSAYDGSAQYAYSPDPDGAEFTLRVRKNGFWYPTGFSSTASLGRSRYYDPSF
jgi:hypothetical protein